MPGQHLYAPFAYMWCLTIWDFCRSGHYKCRTKVPNARWLKVAYLKVLVETRRGELGTVDSSQFKERNVRIDACVTPDAGGKMGAATPIRIGVLGAGTVGGHVIHLLDQWADEYERRLGVRLDVESVLVRRLEAKRAFPIASELLSTDPYAVIDGKDIVVELIGGVEPAFDYVMAALRNGSAVVTGNKALIASRGPELFEAARQANTRLYFEASVAGAIPVIHALSSSLRGDRVRQIAGIVNGTTNFILDAMTTRGADYNEALAQAQELGFAEADPSADVEGYDASAKCAIMSSLSFGRWVSVDSVPRQGITTLSTKDIAFAAELGCVVKLVARAQLRVEAGEQVLALGVEPSFVPSDHAFASLHGPANGVYVEAEAAGTLAFLGLGAGGYPTASAVLGDIVFAARDRVDGQGALRLEEESDVVLAPEWSVASPFIIRLGVRQGASVCETIAAVCASREVSLCSLDVVRGDTEEEQIVTLRTQSVSRDRAHGLVDALQSACDVLTSPVIFPMLDI